MECVFSGVVAQGELEYNTHGMLRSDPQSVAAAPRTEPLRLRSSFKFETHDACHQTQITPTSNIPTGYPVSSGE